MVRRPTPGVAVSGHLTARAQSGGALWYAQHPARLCLLYRVAKDTGETRVADAPCPADVVTTAPADEIIPLAG